MLPSLRQSQVVHAVKRKEVGDDTIVRTECVQSFTGGGIHIGTFSAAGFIRHGEEVWKRVHAGKI
jgi:hypothetical protein